MDDLTKLSERGTQRKPSFIRHLVKYIPIPGMLNLGGGLPNSKLCPLKKMTMTLENGETIEFEGDQLNQMLLYSPSTGKDDLVQWIKEYMEAEHKRNFDENHISVCVSNGSQDALQRTFDLLLEKGDSLLVEQFTYSGALAAVKPIGVNLIEIPIDSQGIIPSKLESILTNWNNKLKFPKAIYVIPTGQNPTGGTLPNERRRKLYEICSKFDLIILEDDPYYWMQFTDSPEYNRLESLFSMDTENRVLRFETFSKVFVSGFRVGWVAGHQEIIKRIGYDLESGAQSASTVPQVIVYNTIKSLGKEGWKKHIEKVSEFYREQRDAITKSVEKYLTGLAEWNKPEAGMFLWLKIKNIEDTSSLVQDEAVKKLILFVPGAAFAPNIDLTDPRSDATCQYIRASFSNLAPEQLDIAIQRLAQLLREKKRERSN